MGGGDFKKQGVKIARASSSVELDEGWCEGMEYRYKGC